MSTAETKPSELDLLFEQAMKLPPEQRLELSERILGSVPIFGSKAEEEKLAETIERRWREIVEGKVQTIPGEEVFRRIRERLDSKDRERNVE